MTTDSLPQASLGRSVPQYEAASSIRKGRDVGLAALAVLLGLTADIRIHVVGDIYVGEVVMVLLLPVALLQGQRTLATSRQQMSLLLLGLAWFGDQIVSDAVNGSPIFNYVRGWSNIAAFLIDFFVLRWVLRTSVSRQRTYILALAAGGIIGLKLTPSVEAAVDAWKFGLAPVISLATLVACGALLRSRKPARLIAVLGLSGCVVVANFLLGYRSEAGILAIATLLTLAPRSSRSQARLAVEGFGRSTRRALLTALALLVLAVGVLAGYSSAAQAGLLGSAAQAKYQSQASIGWGVLVGGRGEIVISAAAILERPVLGFGSWPSSSKYVALADELRGEGFTIDNYVGDLTDIELIQTHSFLFGAWVSAGIIGALFWIYVLGLAVRSASRLQLARRQIQPILAYLAIHLIWDTLFSPFSGESRLTAATALALLVGNLWTQQPLGASSEGMPPPSGRYTARPLEGRLS